MAKSEWAIWSFILAVIPIVLAVFSFIPFIYSLIFGIIYTFLIPYLLIEVIALISGIIALRQIKTSKKLGGKGFAFVGIIISIIFLLFYIWLMASGAYQKMAW